MEVRCSSCATEYEFDDALVSARGTSVKCTNCGHQFRVHPPAGMNTAGGTAETWIVRDARGKETVYRSLRDLQQAIVRGNVDPKHEMSHAGHPFRAMQDIYELQTFFNAARLRPPKPAPRTLLGVGRDGVGRDGVARDVAGLDSEGRASTPPPRKRGPHEHTQERITPVAGMPAVRVPLPAEPPGPTSDVRAQHTESGARPVSRERPSTPTPPPAHVRLDKDKLDTKDERPKKAPSGPPGAGLPWQQLSGLREAELDAMPPSGRVGSRWIALIVVLGGVALIAATVGRKYLVAFTRPSAEAPVVDQRVPQLLEQARVALARGDFENARAELAKASLLAETDPSVAGAKARLELAMAEQVWLEQRVATALEAAAAEKPPARPKTKAAEALEAEAVEKRALEKKQLELSFQDRIGKAKEAVAAAAQRAPEALEVVRARVDALRLTNQLKEARGLVGPLSAQASDPDNAYSLGALDLSEGPSGYTSAIDRLRVAARPEEALGKARALLVYVLALSNDAAAASAELDKLQTLAPRHRALPALRELVDTAQSRTPAAAQPRPAAQPTSSPSAQPARAASSSGGSSASEGDVSVQLNHAATLHRAGDLGGAEKVYQGVIKKSPNNITALSGLGDIARQRRANGTAAAYYDQILKLDRNHVGALMARADLYWHAGNRLLAVALYRRALGQVGQSDPLGQRALRRIEEFDREGAGPGAATGEPSETEPAAGEDTAPAAGEPEPPPDTEEDPEPSAPPSDSTSPSTSKPSTSKPSTAQPPAGAKPAPAPSEEPPSDEGTEEQEPAGQPKAP